MKKTFLLGILIFFLTGCTSINNDNLNYLIQNGINSNITTTNVNRNGYKYYLPKGLSVKSSKEFNEILEDDKYTYYLYVDVVSYHNKTNFTYTINNDAYYSKELKNNEKFGYAEINIYKNNQYLIEIMYNYAKIEVVVYDKDISSAISYAISVLSSVAYNDNVIENYLSNNTLDGTEEAFDIFEVVGSDNYLQFTEEYISGEEITDPDYVN